MTLPVFPSIVEIRHAMKIPVFEEIGKFDANVPHRNIELEARSRLAVFIPWSSRYRRCQCCVFIGFLTKIHFSEFKFIMLSKSLNFHFRGWLMYFLDVSMLLFLPWTTRPCNSVIVSSFACSDRNLSFKLW